MSFAIRALGAAAPVVSKAPSAAPGIIARVKDAVLSAFASLARLFSNSWGAVRGFASKHPYVAGAIALVGAGFAVKALAKKCGCPLFGKSEKTAPKNQSTTPPPGDAGTPGNSGSKVDGN